MKFVLFSLGIFVASFVIGCQSPNQRHPSSILVKYEEETKKPAVVTSAPTKEDIARALRYTEDIERSLRAKKPFSGKTSGLNTSDKIKTKGVKFHPGHYLSIGISRAFKPEPRQEKRLEFIKSYINNEEIRGFMAYYEWKELEGNKGDYSQLKKKIGELLKELEGTDKYLGIYIRDRNFSSKCQAPPVPSYLLNNPDTYDKHIKYHGYICTMKLYNKNVNKRKIALYQAIGKSFDKHPKLEFVTDGESTIGKESGDYYSNELWKDTLIDLFVGAKKELKHTIVLFQMNFLGDGTQYIDQIADKIFEVGGGAMGLPDTVPCRLNQGKDDQYRKNVLKVKRSTCKDRGLLGYTIPGYQTMVRYSQGGVNGISISPNIETFDLVWYPKKGLDDTPIVHDMAIDYLGADHIIWQSSFNSRIKIQKNNNGEKERIGYVEGYAENVLKVLKNKKSSSLNMQNKGQINCPLSFQKEHVGGCIKD